MNRSRALAFFTVAALGAGVAASAAPTGDTAVPVSTVSLNGSRTLSVLTASAGNLSELALGTTDAAPFQTLVTDVTYDHVGYQVDAKLSNLYEYDATAGTYECTADDNLRIPATAFDVTFPTNVDLSGLSATVAPVFDITGDLTGIGITSPIDVDVAGNLFEESLDALADDLPLAVVDGGAQDFTAGMAHPGCAGESAAGDPVFLQTGDPNDLTSLLTAIATSITSTGTTVADYVSAGILDLEVVKSTIRDSLDPALQVVWDGLADSTLDPAVGALTAELQPLSELVGQTGLYTSFPQLNLNRAEVTAPTGVYRGVMQITITDTP